MTRPVTRSEAIERAVLDEVRRRRTLIDANPGLAVLTITCYVQEGPEMIRSVTVSEETRHASRRPPRT